MKKIISICLVLVISVALVCGMVPASAETGYAVGDLPYRTANSRSDIVVSSGENLSFYDDFIVKDNIDSYSSNDDLIGTNGWFLQAMSIITADNSSISINENVANVYGNSGKSLKFSYKKAAPSTAIPQGETTNKYYHRLASKKSITVAKEFWDTAAVTFWVKTEKPVFIVLRCFDYSDGAGNQFLISKEISLPAGESIAEVPLSGLSVVNDGYIKGNNNTNSGKQTVLYRTELLVRGTAFSADETERDIYIDNFGYYNVATNGSKKAEHNYKAVTKLSVEDYQDSDVTTKIIRKDGNLTYNWQQCDAAQSTTKSALSVCNEIDGFNRNACGEAGQSIKYTADTVYNYNTVNYNGLRTNEVIYTSDNNQIFWGSDATLAIWVKTSRAINVYAAAGDGTEVGNNFYKTDKTYLLPAGESILRIPVSDFCTDNPLGAGASCDRAFLWNSLKALRLYFNCASPRENNLSNGITLYIDNIAIEAPVIGDANDDGIIDIRDLVGISDYIGNSEGKELLIFDVGGTAVNEKGYPVADGRVDGNDIAVMIKKLLGTGKLAIEKYKG